MSGITGGIDHAFGSVEALLEVVVAGTVAGIVGVHVVLRRMSFLTIALTHATFPGLVLAGLLGVSLVGGTLVFGVVVVLVIALLGQAEQLESSTATGVVLSGAFALGVLLVSSQDGFSRNLSAYLVGSVTTVSRSDVVVTAIAGAAVLAVLALFGKELVLAAFDPAALAALGYPVLALEVLALVLVEVTVVTSLPAMGTILAVALLVSPAATARLWTERVGTASALAAALGAGSGVLGLAISARYDVAAGATIALCAGAAFGLSLLVSPTHGLAARWLRHRVAPTGSAREPAGAIDYRRPS